MQNIAFAKIQLFLLKFYWLLESKCSSDSVCTFKESSSLFSWLSWEFCSVWLESSILVSSEELLVLLSSLDWLSITFWSLLLSVSLFSWEFPLNRSFTQLIIFWKKPSTSSEDGKFSAALSVAFITALLPNISSLVSPSITKSLFAANKLENHSPMEKKKSPIASRIPELQTV